MKAEDILNYVILRIIYIYYGPFQAKSIRGSK